MPVAKPPLRSKHSAAASPGGRGAPSLSNPSSSALVRKGQQPLPQVAPAAAAQLAARKRPLEEPAADKDGDKAAVSAAHEGVSRRDAQPEKGEAPENFPAGGFKRRALFNPNQQVDFQAAAGVELKERASGQLPNEHAVDEQPKKPSEQAAVRETVDMPMEESEHEVADTPSASDVAGERSAEGVEVPVQSSTSSGAEQLRRKGLHGSFLPARSPLTTGAQSQPSGRSLGRIFFDGRLSDEVKSQMSGGSKVTAAVHSGALCEASAAGQSEDAMETGAPRGRETGTIHVCALHRYPADLPVESRAAFVCPFSVLLKCALTRSNVAAADIYQCMLEQIAQGRVRSVGEAKAQGLQSLLSGKTQVGTC